MRRFRSRQCARFRARRRRQAANQVSESRRLRIVLAGASAASVVLVQWDSFAGPTRAFMADLRGNQSLPKSSLPSSKKLIRTTTADPINPKKNIASSTRIAAIAKSMFQFYPNPNVLHSPLYGVICFIAGLETVGRGGTFRRLARVAVPVRRADASVAICVCVDCAGAADMGAARPP